MAKSCTIPCSLGGVEARIRNRRLSDTLAPNVPVLIAGTLLFLATPVLIPLANWQTALVAAIFFAAGLTVIAARGLLLAGSDNRLQVHTELTQIVDAHKDELHPARYEDMRARAERLTYDTEAFKTRVGQFLEELRFATGEAERCPCPKRRLPLPIPLPF